jgi:Holliday junction resolvase
MVTEKKRNQIEKVDIKTRYYFTEIKQGYLNERCAMQILISNGFNVLRKYRVLFQHHVETVWHSELEDYSKKMYDPEANFGMGGYVPESPRLYYVELVKALGENFEAIRKIILNTKSGLPDILVFSEDKSTCFFVELKTDNDSPSKAQLLCLRELSKYIRVEIFYFYSN